MSRSPLARAGLSVGLSVLLAFSPAYAMGPFQANAPEVEAGMKAFDQGHYDDALKHFDAAQKALPNNPALEFDRGNALYKLKRYDDAQKAYEDVAKADPGELSSKDYYNLGDAWAAMGKNDQAIAAYRKALVLDPNDAQARHNLEVLLTHTPPPKQQQPKQTGPDGGSDGGQNDGGTDAGQPDAGPDAGQPHDGGTDGGADGGMGDGGSDAGTDGGATDGGMDAGSDGGQGQGKGQGQDAGMDAGSGQGEGEQNEGADGGEEDGGSEDQQEAEEADAGTSVSPENLSRQDAERLLDAMKQNEKNLQLWRFQQHKRQRRPNEKDW